MARDVIDLAKYAEQKARDIIAKGGQILLPYDVGDAQIQYDSRYRLARLIKEAIVSAVIEWAE